MAVVRWSDKAADDFIAILERLEQGDPRVARLFARRVRIAIEQLEMFPFSGQVFDPLRSDSVREVQIGRFRLIYLVFSEAEVNIISIRSNA